MTDSNLPFYIAVEIAVALLFVCCFLIFHVGKLKKTLSEQAEKMASLKAAKTTGSALDQAAGDKVYLALLDEKLDETVQQHTSLEPKRDITLDIAGDTPDNRHACALRYAFLLAEKEACYAGEDNASLWATLQSKLLQIAELYEVASSNGEEDSAGQLKAKLADLQQEMLNLQTQHIELEERYLELKG